MKKIHTETVDSKLKTAWQVVSRMYNAEAAMHGGTIAMSHFLLNIDSREGSYASEIAPRLGMESTSLSRIILSMEEKKLIKRIPEKADKRKIKIVLTAKGREKKEIAKSIVREFNFKVEKTLGRESINEFFATIDKITRLAEEKSQHLKK
ncbi:MAG: winged helix-turn-helix transcriptional regulator [Bacteroidetes bacterium]|nr:winged helix-turn-helix transcriptional regulator [Bacteroidota bacterium]